MGNSVMIKGKYILEMTLSLPLAMTGTLLQFTT